MKYPSSDDEDHPNQHKNSNKLCKEDLLSLMENQWKLRQKYDQNVPLEGKQIVGSEERNKPKEQGCESLSQRSKH